MTWHSSNMWMRQSSDIFFILTGRPDRRSHVPLQIARQPVGADVRGEMEEADWNKERDRLFFELLKKLFERRTVTVSYLIGDYFSKSWAERSIQYLCFKRHAYQGQNLYSKGACYAAMERAGLIAERGILFGGQGYDTGQSADGNADSREGADVSADQRRDELV